MSDEEEEHHSEAEEEEEAEEAEAPPEAEEEEKIEEEEVKPVKKAPPKREVVEDIEPGQSEAERAIQAAKKRHEEEDALKLLEFEERRKIEREKEEEELRQLKEKQERRKREREEEEKLMAERKQEEDARRLQEEAERKRKAEEDKLKREEDKKRKQQMMAGGAALAAEAGKPNFTIEKSDAQFAKFGNIVKAKAEMGLTKEQQEEMKKKALRDLIKPFDSTGMDIASLRAKIKEMHAKLAKLEGAKYDLEIRADRQAYDLKELNERQRQINRNKAMKKGLDPEAGNSRHPPKLPTASKYDRQVDRRSYTDRYVIFENPPAKPNPRIFHGSARPPETWGRKEIEELDIIRRNQEGPRYVEAVPVEGAKPPMDPIPVQMPPEEPVGGEEEE